MALQGLEDKVAVVTGGASGIGAAVARRLVEERVRGVVVVDLDTVAAQRTAEQLGTRAVPLGADVSVPEGADAYVSAALEAFGRIDLFHNNAGIEGTHCPIARADVADFDRVIAVNLRGAFLGLRAMLRHMGGRESGAIVNTSSVTGLRGRSGLGAYVASKHGVLGLTKCASIEAAPHGVRVNAVCPGPTETRMMESIDRMVLEGAQEGQGRAERASPMGRYAMPAEVAALVCWLLSDEAAHVTGAGYPVDGGATSW